jgi:hypothetical protein
MKTIIFLKSFWRVVFLFISFYGLLLSSTVVLAHETWVLTPELIDHWNAQKLPDIFTQFSTLNVLMISFFLVFIIGWIYRST